MGFFDSIKLGIKNHFEKQRERREQLEQIQRQADAEANVVFQKQFKEHSVAIAKKKAYQDAAKKSGIQKLRAMNRARRLNETGAPPGSFFAKLSEYTQKNIAKREENLARTKVMREEAQKLRREKMEKRIAERQENMARSSGFGQSTWKM